MPTQTPEKSELSPKKVSFKKIKNVHFIINPAAGKFKPVLSLINDTLKDSGIQWEISITKKTGDGTRIVKELLEKKVDVIGVCGGDGTLMEVISGMMGSATPLAILPGGTANVLATDLGISKDFAEACSLLTKPEQWMVKSLDIGKFNKRYFILRLSSGFEAEMVKGADRETKNRFGRLAYFFSALSAIQKVKLIDYEVKVDGKQYNHPGLTCIIANSGSVGFADLSLDQAIDVSDGLLDVLLIKKIDLSLFKYIWRILLKGNPSQDRQLVGHWRGKEIEVSSRPPQVVQCDGEIIGKTLLRAEIIPQAVRILVPRPSPAI